MKRSTLSQRCMSLSRVKPSEKQPLLLPPSGNTWLGSEPNSKLSASTRINFWFYYAMGDRSSPSKLAIVVLGAQMGFGVALQGNKGETRHFGVSLKQRGPHPNVSELQSRPVTRMVNPEPCKELKRRPHLFMSCRTHLCLGWSLTLQLPQAVLTAEEGGLAQPGCGWAPHLELVPLCWFKLENQRLISPNITTRKLLFHWPPKGNTESSEESTK